MSSIALFCSTAQAVTLAHGFATRAPIVAVPEDGTGVDEVRVTFHQIMLPVRFRRLGAVMRPFQTDDIISLWSIHGANADHYLLSPVASCNADVSSGSLTDPGL